MIERKEARTLRAIGRDSSRSNVSRKALLADAGIAIASEWMFAPEIKDGTVKVVLRDWTLPQIDFWAVFPAGRTTAKARIFTEFVQELMRVPSGVAGLGAS
jgi:DNA-binding transcriptional LysR family regulator